MTDHPKLGFVPRKKVEKKRCFSSRKKYLSLGLIRSVKALNDDLYRSNSKMIKQNAHLLNGMRFAEWTGLVI